MKSELENVHHRVSQRKYQHVDLEDDEFVELEMRRSKVGIVLIWVLAGLFIAIIVTMMILFVQKENFYLNETSLNRTIRIILLIGLGILCPISLFVAATLTYVYRRNVMYVTNHRVIQITKTSPFSQSRNVIELASVVDASYKQKGIPQYLFHYGTLHLATVVNESDYTFPFLDTPKDELDTISHLVHQEKEKKK